MKTGLIAASIAVALVIIGIFKGTVPANPLSIGLALLISGVSWFLVAWAIATAVSDVEKDLATSANESDSTSDTASPSKS